MGWRRRVGRTDRLAVGKLTHQTPHEQRTSKVNLSALKTRRAARETSPERAAATRAERTADVEADTIRTAILARMEVAGLLRSDVAALVKGSVGKDSVYSYLGPEARPINSRYASAIMAALGLEVVVSKKGKPCFRWRLTSESAGTLYPRGCACHARRWSP